MMSPADMVAPLLQPVKRFSHEPRRVLVVSPQPFYEDRGTPIAVRQLLHALTELGYQVDLLTYPIGDSPEIPGVRYVRGTNPLRFRSVPIGLSLRKLTLDAALVVTLARRLRHERYAAIHALEEGAFPAALAARWLGIPLIYDMQSSMPEQLTKHRLLGTRLMQAGLRACERWLLRHADRIICSAGLTARVRSLVPETPVREWTFFAEPRRVLSAAEAAEVRRSVGIEPDQRVVLYTGSFAGYQGIDLLLAAAAKLRASRPEVVLVLVGGSAEEQREVRRAAARLKLDPHLRVLGRLSRKETSTLLQAADVLVSPRLFGGNLPLKIFDYMAAARPIVATDIPTHRTVLNEQCAVLASPTPTGIARGIEQALDDPAAAAALAEAAYASAGEHYGWPAFVRMVDDLYTDALGACAAVDSAPAARSLASGTAGF
jgi:glycosyltransferase involved in cell wall biosynthesis